MSRFGIGIALLVIAVVLALGGLYEWNQTKTCSSSAGAKCLAKKGNRTHPRRAEGLWLGAVVFAVAGGIVVAQSRRTR